MTDTISRICSIIGYCLFGSINSIEHTVYGIVRNITGQALIKSNKIYQYFLNYMKKQKKIFQMFEEVVESLRGSNLRVKFDPQIGY